MRIVPDINTTVSGLLWSGPSAYLLRAVNRDTVQLYSTKELVLKFAEVVQRSKFAQRLR